MRREERGERRDERGKRRLRSEEKGEIRGSGMGNEDSSLRSEERGVMREERG